MEDQRSNLDTNIETEWPINYKIWFVNWAFIQPPTKGTRACKKFFFNWAKINHFGVFYLDMVLHVEHTNNLVREIRKEIDQKNTELSEEEKIARSPVKVFHSHKQLFFELLLCRHIDNYLNYLSNSLYEIFLKRPELLKTSEMIRTDLILEQASINEIIRVIAEKKILQLSYGSFSDLSKYIEDKLGLSLFFPKDIPKVIEAIETRNLSVHNGCFIDQRYIDHTKADPSLIGKRKVVGVQDVEPLGILLGHAVKRFDNNVRNKYHLDLVNFVIDPISQDEEI